MRWQDHVPFAYLRNFEAAGRASSFADAAEELHLSPSAVSHSVRRLEDVIGTKLFSRHVREVELTREGTILLGYVQRAMDEVRRGFAHISSDDVMPLRLHAAPSFATQWLLPRLSRFVIAHPEVDLRFAVSADYSRFEDDELDLDIVYGEPAPSPYETIPLVIEGVAPLCSPEIAKSISKPEDLFSLPLIHCDSQKIQWKVWFEANDMTPPVHYALRFDRSSMAIAAAVDGLGVVLDSTFLAQRELSHGHLVRPLSACTRDLEYIGHYLVYPKRLHHHIGFDAFRRWLLVELGLTGGVNPGDKDTARIPLLA